MRYISHSPSQIDEIIKNLGIDDVSELFDDIPDEFRLKEELDLPEALDEIELKKEFVALGNKNKAPEYASFMGAGIYDHHVPAVVKALTGRSEFYTSYTPYQAEISQGTLASIFEYQTMIAKLTGMDVVNASIYDGATSLAEAVLMACDVKRKDRVVISEAVHPEYIETVKTYAFGLNKEVCVVPYDENLETKWNEIENSIDDDTAALVVSMPNFFGVLEDVEKASKIADEKKLMLIVVANPISLGLLVPPGDYGADIVVGEGQPLGNVMNFGGPGVGFMGTKKKFTRRLPGRIVGETVDADGDRGFVLTLQAREQHIRRQRATSNICSNQQLNALAATIYLAYLGEKGLRDVAYHSHLKARYFIDEAKKDGKINIINDKIFNEVAVEVENLDEKFEKALEHKVIPGVKLDKFFSNQKNRLLVAFTEKRSKAEIDKLLDILRGEINE